MALDMDNNVHCPVCGTGRGIPTGNLGRMMHYSCHRCGYKFSNVVKQASLNMNKGASQMKVISFRDWDTEKPLIDYYRNTIETAYNLGFTDEAEKLENILKH